MLSVGKCWLGLFLQGTSDIFAGARGGRWRTLMLEPLMRQLSLIGVAAVCAGVLSRDPGTPFSSRSSVQHNTSLLPTRADREGPGALDWGHESATQL